MTSGLRLLLALVALSGLELTVVSAKTYGEPNPSEKEIQYWRRMAEETLAERLKVRPIEGVAKNLILFIGDGMSISTLTASRIYLGQLFNQSGESTKLSFERFPYTGLSKTYCVDKQVADSASTSTSYVGGVKANFGTIGVSAEVPLGDCNKSNDPRTHVDSLVNWALASGKATGVVTNDELTGASPAGNYAHTAFRFWQSDRDEIIAPLPADPTTCPDIARQLIQNYPGQDIKVLLGGGRLKFLPEKDGGERLDGRNLVEEWKQDKRHKGKAKYVTSREELKNVDVHTDYVFGLFSDGVMPPHNEEEDQRLRPSLAEMTEAAIKLLKKEKNGFYLFVESSEIDKFHHSNQAGTALDETVELHKAVLAALSLVDIQDTLIVVTADHAHTLTMSGYPDRGNDILGIAGISTEDLLPYTTLSYATGPGAEVQRAGPLRRDVSMDDFSDLSYTYPALVPMLAATHGGDDVAVFSQGPWAHLLVGSFEENYIPIVMAYAAQIGPCGTEAHSSYLHPVEKPFSEFRVRNVRKRPINEFRAG
uniref:alkaline phosphatase n=1 Tax=Homalodisca liturata TaxID=320908 RepID=A0A1B6K132_9HEMI